MPQMMKALVKREADQGHLDGTGAGAGDRPQRGAGQAGKDRDLRHRPAHLQVGRVEPAHHQARPGDRPRIRRPHRRHGRGRAAAISSASACRPKATSSAASAATAAPASQHLCPHTVGIGVNRDGAFAEYIAMPASNLWPIPDQIPQRARRLLRPLRQRRALRAGVRPDRRGRADHRRGPDRHHRRRHLQARRRAQRGGDRRQRLPPEAGRRHGRHAGGQRLEAVGQGRDDRTSTWRASTSAWK